MGCIFYKKYAVPRKCLRKGCVNPECRFRNINEAIIELKGSIHREIANLKDSMMIVIRVLGNECEKYYGMEA